MPKRPEHYSRTVHLRHVTTWANYATIAVEGLHVEACHDEAKRRAIWLHAPSQTAWAVLHTMHRHHVELGAIVVLELAVKESHLKHHGKGRWYTQTDIPETAIRRVISGVEFAGWSPDEGREG